MHVSVVQVLVGNPLGIGVSTVGTIPTEPRELCNGNTGLGELAMGTSLGMLSGNICGTYHGEQGRECHWDCMWVPPWRTVLGTSLGM
jgi:hypothetical protein